MNVIRMFPVKIYFLLEVINVSMNAVPAVAAAVVTLRARPHLSVPPRHPLVMFLTVHFVHGY